jgi:hypothetical protein
MIRPCFVATLPPERMRQRSSQLDPRWRRCTSMTADVVQHKEHPAPCALIEVNCNAVQWPGMRLRSETFVDQRLTSVNSWPFTNV